MLLGITLIICAAVTSLEGLGGIARDSCTIFQGKLNQPISDHRRRLHAIREQMIIRASLQGPEIDGYILTSYDEHLNEEVAERDKRLKYLTGFTGSYGYAAITFKKAALWTTQKYIQQANGELNCDWELYEIDGSTNLTSWLSTQLYADMRVGADPHIVPHFIWSKWKEELKNNIIDLVKVNTNLIDLIWGLNRPPPDERTIKVHELRFSGEKWQSKINSLRDYLLTIQCDAFVISSLTEIAYVLNIRGRDILYTPVIKSYLIVTHEEIFFYTDRTKITLGIMLHFKADPDLCHHKMCIQIKDYKQIWKDLRTYAQLWKRVLIPAPCVFDKGASEALYTAISEKIVYEKVSPIIHMKAQKNDVERDGMKKAHIRDGAAICEAMCNIEQRFSSEKWTELKLKFELDRSRLLQSHSKGLSTETVVAFGPHSSIPYYAPSNVTDIEVTDENLIIIESGGQYLEGTTDVSRTYHYGTPTPEQKTAYTNVLAGIIRLSNLKFPADLQPSEIDALSRSPVWDTMSDYPHATGHGIGSYSSVRESPIDVSYVTKEKYHFYEGYFFSNEPGYYKKGSFGIRLDNVLEVIDTGRVHPSGAKFLSFEKVTLVPYEPKLIDRTLLSAQEKRWLNNYNAKIRNLVGDELKRQGNMQAFYWMMNKTRHIREYLPENEYRNSGVNNNFIISNFTKFTCILNILIYIIIFY